MSLERELYNLHKSYYYQADLLSSIFSFSTLKKKKKNEASAESDKKFRTLGIIHAFSQCRLPWSLVATVFHAVPSWPSDQGTAFIVFKVVK